MQVFLEHAGLIFNTRYAFIRDESLKPYLNLAVGWYYWKGIRGAIQSNAQLNIPYIEKQVLEEWNWGFTAGLGLEIKLMEMINLDLLASYRFIVGDLWPTLQEHIELENVSGFQTVNLQAGLRYYFRLD